MNLNTIIFKRRRILGDLYPRCAHIMDTIPVFLDDATGEPIGTIEESAAQYGDAFIFRLPGDVCKIFAVDGYNVGMDYDFSDKNKTTNKDSITLNHILLVTKPKALPFGKRSKHQTSE